MNNLRIRNTKRERHVTEDWYVCGPHNADFLFRIWGGSNDFPHLKPTKKMSEFNRLSSNAVICVKALVPHVYDVLNDLNYQRMFDGRVGGAQNPGGNIFTVESIVREYNLRCEELGIEQLKNILEDV